MREMQTRVRAALGEREVIVLASGLDLEIVKRPVDDAAFGESDSIGAGPHNDVTEVSA